MSCLSRIRDYSADLRLLDSDLNAVIMDYLISEGYPSAAQKFAHEANIAPMLDVDSVEERVSIRRAIYEGDIQAAIEQINELNPQVSPARPKTCLLETIHTAMIILVHAPLIDPSGC